VDSSKATEISAMSLISFSGSRQSFGDVIGIGHGYYFVYNEPARLSQTRLFEPFVGLGISRDNWVFKQDDLCFPIFSERLGSIFLFDCLRCDIWSQ
jgi:hypothetical protein